MVQCAMEETWEGVGLGCRKGEYECRVSRLTAESPLRGRLVIINLKASFLSKCGLQPPACESPGVLVNTLLIHTESNSLGVGPHNPHC